MKVIIAALIALSSLEAVRALSPGANQWFNTATDKAADLLRHSVDRVGDIFGDDLATLQALLQRAKLTPKCMEVEKQIEKYLVPENEIPNSTGRLIESFNSIIAPCRRLNDDRAAACIGNVLNTGFARIRGVVSKSLASKFKNFEAIANFEKLLVTCEAE